MISKLAVAALVASSFGSSVTAKPGKFSVKKNNCKENSKRKACAIDASAFPDLATDAVPEIELQLKPDGPTKLCKHVPGSSKKMWHGEDDGLTCNISRSGKKNKNGEALLYGSVVDEVEAIVYQLMPDADGENQIIATASSDFEPELDPHSSEDLFSDEMEQEDWWLRGLGESSFLNEEQDEGHRHLADDGSQLDVLVVWTKEAECATSGRSFPCTLTATTEQNMRELIQDAIEETNVAYQSSGVEFRLNLAHAYRTNSYTESGKSFSSALTAVRKAGDGEMDEVHALREQHNADIVSMITAISGSCGIGYIGPSKDWMFSVTKWSCATGNFSFGHEIGHNLGCNHDRGAKDLCDDTTKTQFGWRDPQGRFRSILAYDCKTYQCDNNAGSSCTRVQRFSNNNYLYNGSPIGDDNNDNVQRMNSVRHSVANYFVGAPVDTPAPVITPNPTPRPTPAPVVTPSPTPLPTKAPVVTSSPTPLPTKAPVVTPSPTARPTLRPTLRPTAAPVLATGTIATKKCSKSKPCGLCEGDCDGDNNECKDGLVCLKRSKNDKSDIDGCSGSPKKGKDYCIPE